VSSRRGISGLLARVTLGRGMHPDATSAARSRPRELAYRAPIGDVLVALVAFALTLALMAGRGDATRGLDAVGVVLAAIACVPLVARRRAPLAVLAVTTAASATLNGLGYALGPPFGPTIALFYVAADERTASRRPQTASVVAGASALHIGVTAITRSTTTPILWAIIVWGGAWIAGDQLRQRRHRRADAAERARRRELELDRERRLAAAEERTRIARDLHDSAAHAVNVILVQAGAARLLQGRDPTAVQEALSTIEDVARDTIGEIDQLIRGLRDDGGAERHGEAIEPPTGLAALGTLAARHRAAGSEIEIHVLGRPRSLAVGVDQAAYRILQESLTNAARHGTGPAEVKITYGARQLELVIANGMGMPPVAGAEATQSGHGILGMRERAALLGGSVEARSSNGRFRVHARLPYSASDER
jgi:signal transduction histidine kinase